MGRKLCVEHKAGFGRYVERWVDGWMVVITCLKELLSAYIVKAFLDQDEAVFGLIQILALNFS